MGKTIKDGLKPIEEHLKTAREIFLTETIPDPECVPMPLISTKGSAAKYGGDYTKYYTPLDGCTYINFVPEAYKNNSRVFEFAARTYMSNEALYLKWHEIEQCLEIATVRMNLKRNDKKLNLDKRSWVFDSGANTYYLERVILFPKDGYAYFKNEALNEECGRYYNKNVYDQVVHSCRDWENTKGWASKYVTSATEQYAKLNNPDKDSILSIYGVLTYYKDTIERTVVAKTNVKQDKLKEFESKLKPLSDLTGYKTLVKKYSNSGYSYSDSKVYNQFIYTDKIDENNICLRYITVDYDRRIFDSIVKSMAVGSTKEIEGTLGEYKRIWFTGDECTIQHRWGRGSDWYIGSIEDIRHMNNFRTQNYMDIFNCKKFEPYIKYLNNPDYSNRFRAKLLYHFMKYPIMKQIFDEGLTTLGEYIVNTAAPNTVLKDLFGSTSSSKDIYKHVDFTKEQLNELTNNYMFVKSKYDATDYEYSYNEDCCTYHIDLNNTALPSMLNTIFGADLKAMTKAKFEDTIKKCSAIVSHGRRWMMAVVPGKNYWSVMYKEPLEEEEIKNVKNLLNKDMEAINKIICLIKKGNNCIPTTFKEIIATKKLDIYDEKKYEQNKAELIAAKVTF